MGVKQLFKKIKSVFVLRNQVTHPLSIGSLRSTIGPFLCFFFVHMFFLPISG